VNVGNPKKNLLKNAREGRTCTPAHLRLPDPLPEMLPFFSEIAPGCAPRPLTEKSSKRPRKEAVPSSKKKRTPLPVAVLTSIPSTSSPGAYGLNTPVAPAPLAPLPSPPLPPPFTPPPPSTLVTRFPAPAPPVMSMPADIVEVIMQNLKSKIPYQCVQPIENLAETDPRLQREDFVFPSFLNFLPLIRFGMTCRAAYECGGRMGLFSCKKVLRVKVLPERRVSYVKANYYGPDHMSNITFGECLCFQVLPGVWCLLDEAVAVNHVIRDAWDVHDGHSVRSRMRGCVRHSNLVSFLEEETYGLINEGVLIFRNRTRHESCLENGRLQVYSNLPTSWFDVPPPPGCNARDATYILSHLTITLHEPFEIDHDEFYIALWVSVIPMRGIILCMLRPDGTYRYKGVRM